MSRCKNMVEQVVPTRYAAKIIRLPCGSTSIYGEPLYCEQCVLAGAVARPAYEYEDAGDDDRDPNWRFEPSD